MQEAILRGKCAAKISIKTDNNVGGGEILRIKFFNASIDQFPRCVNPFSYVFSIKVVDFLSFPPLFSSFLPVFPRARTRQVFSVFYLHLFTFGR